jgi:hypothetical protein
MYSYTVEDFSSLFQVWTSHSFGRWNGEAPAKPAARFTTRSKRSLRSQSDNKLKDYARPASKGGALRPPTAYAAMTQNVTRRANWPNRLSS